MIGFTPNLLVNLYKENSLLLSVPCVPAIIRDIFQQGSQVMFVQGQRKCKCVQEAGWGLTRRCPNTHLQLIVAVWDSGSVLPDFEFLKRIRNSRFLCVTSRFFLTVGM